MKKEILMPILVAALTIAFGFVCFLMFFKKNNRRLTNWKMKIGALLLTLNAVAGCSSFRNDDVSCYLSPSEEKPVQHLYGPGFGYNRALTEYRPAGQNDSSSFFQGNNFYIGVNYRYYFDDIRLSRNVIGLSLTYETRNGSNIYSPKDTNFFINYINNYNSQNKPVINSTQRIILNYINLTALYNFYVIEDLYVNAGLKFSYNLTHKISENIEIQDNYELKQDLPGVVYETNKKATIYDKGIENFNYLRLGVPAGIGYSLRINNKFFVEINVSYDFGLTNGVSNGKLDLNSLEAGINILLPFNK